jgi:3-hydroxyisobutyrate dehydrogenase
MQITPELTRIGWIGTGVMGRSMCGRLLQAGYHVTLYTRTRSKSDQLIDLGAVWADSPCAVAEVSHVVCTIVGYPHDVREVYMGAGGVLSGCQQGSILIDMTTSEPSLAKEIFAAAVEAGAQSIDAPVSGGDIGARGGTLSIMIGGDEATAHDLEAIWQVLGTNWVYQGGPGAGQHTKLVNQTLIAAGMVAVCEGLLYAYRAGLDVERVLQSVTRGAAGSWSLTHYAPRMIAGNFEPGFVVEHFIKDMGIALAESRRMGLALPGLALAQQLYIALAAQGHSRKGTHSLILALAKLSGVNWGETIQISP